MTRDRDMTVTLAMTLSDREKAVALLTGSVLFVAGLWAGLMLVPDAALDVPATSEMRGGTIQYDARYLPVPQMLPLLSVAIPAIGAWFAYQTLRADPGDREAGQLEDVATDGGDDR
jgi:uncharacterized membrane protein YiaA